MNSVHTPEPAYRLELFVRSLAPTGGFERQQAVFERIDRLEEDIRLESVSCVVWGDRICPGMAAQVPEGQAILDAIDRFRRWAQRTGASLDPWFEPRAVHSMFEEPHQEIDLPSLCLAVYNGDALYDVFPCRKGGETYSVLDGLGLVSEHETLAPVACPVGDIAWQP